MRATGGGRAKLFSELDEDGGGEAEEEKEKEKDESGVWKTQAGGGEGGGV